MKRWHLARWAPIFPFRGMTKLSEIQTLRETSGFKKYIKERERERGRERERERERGREGEREREGEKERERGRERRNCLALFIENGCDKIKDKQNNHCPL